MTARCALCGSVCPRRFTVGGWAIHRCAACDLEFVWPLPSREEIARVYAAGYFSGGGHGYLDYAGRERALAARKAATRLDALAALGVHQGSLLDVGCAAGYFMAAARDRGFTVRGVEPSPEALAALTPDLVPWVLPTLAAAAPHGPYDAVTLWDVLEHLPDPLGCLRTVRTLVRPGGVVALVLPVLGNVNTRWWPRRWDQYKPPEHLWYPSPAAVRAMVACTLGVPVIREDIAWQRHGRWVDPEGLRTGAVISLVRALDRGAGRALTALLGTQATVDAMAFYARCP